MKAKNEAPSAILASALAAYSARDYATATILAKRASAAAPYALHPHRLLRACYLAVGDDDLLAETDQRIDRYLGSYTDVGMRMGARLLAAGDTLGASRQFATALAARRMLDQTQMLPYGIASKARLLHDERYLSFLCDEGKIDKYEFEIATEALRKLCQRFNDEAIERLSLSDNTIMDISGVYRNALHLEKEVAVESPVNSVLILEKITEALNGSSASAAYGDGFFSPSALANIRDHLVYSSIWHNDDHSGGQYVSSDDGIGLLSPTLLNAKRELETLVNRVRSDLRLEQVWAFKALPGSNGIKPHADYSDLNINIWMTPDIFNKSKTSGGLRIFDVKCERNEDFEEYNGDENYVAKRINGASSVSIPYGFNRFCVFDGTYYHASDNIQFDEAYPGWRINLTFIFAKK